MIDHDDIDDMNDAARRRRESDAAIPTPASLLAERRQRDAPSEAEVQRNLDSVVRQLRESVGAPSARTHGSTALLREVARRLTARGWECRHDESQQVLAVAAAPVLRGAP